MKNNVACKLLYLLVWTDHDHFGPKIRIQRILLFAASLNAHRMAGCYGMESVLGPLKPVFERSNREGLLIDVGANMGQGASAIINVFGEVGGHIPKQLKVTVMMIPSRPVPSS